MTIDPPFLAFWCWSLICVWKGLASGRTGWWAGAGACAALGTLAKYTMALFPAAVVGYLLFHRRAEFRRPGVWILLAGAALGWLPVLVWNAQHDWVSFRHVFGQVGAPGRGGVRWDGAAFFLGGQFGMMFGFWLVAFLGAGWFFRPARETDPGVRLLWWVSVPVWCLFAAASFVKPGQPNWPAPAYVGGFVLAVAWVRERWSGPRLRLVRWGVGLSVVSGLIVAVALYFPYAVRPLLARVVPAPSEKNPLPVRGIDLTARLTGWKQLAAEVDATRDRLRAETGREPVIAGTHWTLPGTLRFYCAGHPDVYSIGTANASDRHSQYDLWRPNPVDDAQDFRGRTFVIVGDIGPGTAAAFERVEHPWWVVHAGGGVPVARWAVWVCHGFRGFAPAVREATGRGY
jgi:4-amino-4-deoxy-L-arabinose transferase-like glycosyltransferase